MNKIKLLLLFLPLTTQCMKRNNTELTLPQSTKIQKLQKKRDEFKEKLIKSHKYNAFWWTETFWWTYGGYNKNFLSSTYLIHLHKKKINHIDVINDMDEGKKFFGSYNIDNLHQLNQYELQALHEARIKNYSALGSATMAEEVSFKEKKEFIQKLLNLNFTPTPEDKKLALLATYEEHGTSIIKKKILLKDSLVLTEMNMPQEIIDYIALLMFETKLLF